MNANADKREKLFAIAWDELFAIRELTKICRDEDWFSPGAPHEYENAFWSQIVNDRRDGDVYRFNLDQIKALRGALYENNIPRTVFRKCKSYEHADAKPYHMAQEIAAATKVEREYWITRLSEMLDPALRVQNFQKYLLPVNKLRRLNERAMQQQEEDEFAALDTDERQRRYDEVAARVEGMNALVVREEAVAEEALRNGQAVDTGRLDLIERIQRRDLKALGWMMERLGKGGGRGQK
jgi:hypothetical protein